MNTTTPSARADIGEAFDLAGFTTETSRWGHLQARIDADRTIRITEDDGTFYVTLFTGGRAMLIAGEVRLNGAFATPVMLAATIEMAL